MIVYTFLLKYHIVSKVTPINSNTSKIVINMLEKLKLSVLFSCFALCSNRNSCSAEIIMQPLVPELYDNYWYNTCEKISCRIAFSWDVQGLKHHSLYLTQIILWLIKYCHIQDKKNNAIIFSDWITTLY